MPSLKDLKNRIGSVQSTKRITSAMKMVAAAKLRKAQEAADSARPYADHMNNMLGALASGVTAGNGPQLLVGTGKTDKHLFVVITSDRGLCGGLNGNLVRSVKREIDALQAENKQVQLLVVGRKGTALLKRIFADLIIEQFEDLLKPAPKFTHSDKVSAQILSLFEARKFDICTIFYNKFISALTQEVTPLQLIPFKIEDDKDKSGAVSKNANPKNTGAIYEYEPDEEQILAEILPKNLAVQVYRAMLDSFASEQGARMTAMDNATRNAGDMINKLSIRYNRTRQAQITKELIEIISGAEAL